MLEVVERRTELGCKSEDELADYRGSMHAVHTVVLELKTILHVLLAYGDQHSCLPYVRMRRYGCRGRNACDELDAVGSSPLLTVLPRFSGFWFQNSLSPEELSAP